MQISRNDERVRQIMKLLEGLTEHEIKCTLRAAEQFCDNEHFDKITYEYSNSNDSQEQETTEDTLLPGECKPANE
jgi:hypothetical protein